MRANDLSNDCRPRGFVPIEISGDEDSKVYEDVQQATDLLNYGMNPGYCRENAFSRQLS